MRETARIATAWTPYAVTFSHDGTRLAIGGGTWYGSGGITLYDLRTRARVDFPIGRIDPALLTSPHQNSTQRSVGNLAFTSDDRHLLAATWTASVRQGAAIAFEVDGMQLRQAGAVVTPNPITGIVPHGRGALLRIWRTHLGSTVSSVQWNELTLAGPGRVDLTDHRLAVVRDHALTGNHGANGGNAPAPPLRPGVIAKMLGGSICKLLHHGDGAITAIGTCGERVVTGNANGELVSWQWEAEAPEPSVERILGTIETSRPVTDTSALWALYYPAGVVSICTLIDGRVAAITAGGALATSLAGRPLQTQFLADPGTPRSIAAHPDRAMLAIGIKCNREGERSSVVVLEEPSTLAAAWRTARVTQVVEAFDPDRPLDPTTLSVLADALEEAGAPAQLLEHLRTHDHRLRTCWVLDQLRD